MNTSRGKEKTIIFKHQIIKWICNKNVKKTQKQKQINLKKRNQHSNYNSKILFQKLQYFTYQTYNRMSIKNIWNGLFSTSKGLLGVLSFGFYNANQEMEQLEKRLSKLQLIAKQSPQKAVQIMKEMRQLIYASYGSIKFPQNKNCKNIIFIGKTSVGKSSLLNKLFLLQIKTSKGSCTNEMSVVKTIDNYINIYDCPGFDTHFDLTKNPRAFPEYLGKMDVIYYLYDHPEEHVIKACLAMRKLIYFVRTKCDPDEAPEENQNLKADDTKSFIAMGIQKPRIFFTSKKGGGDNDELLANIKS